MNGRDYTENGLPRLFRVSDYRKNYARESVKRAIALRKIFVIQFRGFHFRRRLCNYEAHFTRFLDTKIRSTLIDMMLIVSA